MEKGFHPYFNPEATKYLESQVLHDLWEERDHVGPQYYGAVSHQFRLKTGMTWDTALWMCEENEGYDVYACKSRFSDKIKNVWLQGDMWHPNFSEIGESVGRELGVDFLSLETPPIYYNYWWTRPEIFEDFVTSYLKPAMEFLDTYKPAFEDSTYRVKAERDVDEELLVKIFGKPYYTYHPFICERLFPSYVAEKKLTYKLI